MKIVIKIASDQERSEVYAELATENGIVADVFRDDQRVLQIEIYPTESGSSWTFDLDEWLEALAEARRALR